MKQTKIKKLKSVLSSELVLECENAMIARVEINLEPDGCIYPRIIIHNEKTFPSSKPDYQRSFTLRSPEEPRSRAENLGGAIMALFWVLDRMTNLSNLVCTVIIVHHNQGHIVKIQNSILPRILSVSPHKQDEDGFSLPYPFYTYIPKVEANQKAKK